MQFPFFRKWRREHVDKPEAETRLAKKQVHETAEKSGEKVAELHRALVENHITIRIYAAMGGRHGH